MKLDDIYINESIRIRKTYLNNLAKIALQEEEIKKYSDSLNSIKEEINNTDEEEVDEKFQMRIMLDMNKSIDKIQKKLSPYYNEIRKLDTDQKTLYNSIKEKYPFISDEEIQKQIVPHIVIVDKDFMKRNKKLYKKITNEKNG